MNIDLQSLTNGNQSAQNWVVAWGKYSRACDDTVDNSTWDAKSLSACFSLGVQCYSGKFYVEHRQALQVATLIATSLWAKSCQWEKEPELWKRQWADVLRHGDVAILSTIALLCGGGWDGIQTVTGAFLSAGYVQHFDKYGSPT